MSLVFPIKILDQHLVCLGKTGAGKSSALRYVVEYLLGRNKRVCIIDPKGDWWGLKSSADGKHAGYPVIAFGDFKNANASDVPINEYSGKHVAELIASGNRPCVIGFRGWMTSHMVQFWIDFASTLFNANAGELYLVIDEVHHFAPKGKIHDPQAGKCLHWSNRLMNEGRGIGLVNLIASQRPQKVHNDTLTACETLVAMRVIHKADRDAVEDWIKGCGDAAQGKEVLNSLAGMARGEAYVWSPEAGFGPSRLAFPMFETFDSFAPPQLQKKINERSWADVDLTEVRDKLAAVIEKVKAEDPRELKKIIADLRKQLAKKPHVELPEPVVEVREVPVLANGHLKTLELLVDQLESMGDGLMQIGEGVKSAADSIVGAIAKAQASVPQRAAVVLRPSARPAAPEPHTPRGRREASDEGSSELGKMGRRMLIALAQHPKGLSKKQILIFSGYRSSGDTSSMFATLVREGLVYPPNQGLLTITHAGLARLGQFEPLPQGEALRERLLQEAGPMQRRFLEVLFEVYPNSISKGEILERSGYRSSGDTSSMFAKLVAMNYAQKSGASLLRAADELFEGK